MHNYDSCGTSRFSRTKSTGPWMSGSSDGFATHRWCDSGLVTFFPGPQFPISSHWSPAAFPALWMECRVKQSWAGSFLWRVSLESYDLKAELAFYYQGPVLNFVIIQTSCFSYPPMPLFNDWARGVKVGTLNQMLLLGTSCDDLGGRLKLFFF